MAEGGDRRNGRRIGNYYDDTHEARIVDGVISASKLQKCIWDVMESYTKHYGPATQMIQSFNHFMKHSLPEIITTCGFFEHEELLGPSSRMKKLHCVQVTQVCLEENVIVKEKDGTVRRLYPHEARIRNLHYTKILYAEIVHKIYRVDAAGLREILVEEKEEICLGEIPIMIKSEQCSLYGLNDQQLMEMHEDPGDPGGYFIINGKEKVLISQERAAFNQLFLFKPMCDADYQLEAEIRSSNNTNTDEVSAVWIRIPGDPMRPTSKNFGRPEYNPTVFDPRSGSTGKASTSHHVEPNGTSDWIFAHKKSLYRKYKLKFPGLVVSHMALMEPIPLLILYKALGLTNDKSIWKTFGISDARSSWFFENIRSTMESDDSVKIKTKGEALIFIGKLRRQASSEKFENIETGMRRVYSEADYLVRGQNFVNCEILPHVGDGEMEDDDKLKGYHIGYMVNRLIHAHESCIPCDDRDHLENKRFDLAGPLMAGLLKRLVNNMFEEMRKQVKRKVENKRPYNFFKNVGGSSSLTGGFIYAFMSGNWGDKRKSQTIRVGVVQPLNRVTGLATLAFLRRINSPVNRLVRMTAPRMVHNTGWGYICPADTPEGEPVGLLKNLSIMAHVSVECDKTPVMQCLKDLNYYPISKYPDSLSGETKILLNASLVGSYPDKGRLNPLLLVNNLKQRRSEWDEIMHRENNIQLWKTNQERQLEEQRQGLPNNSLKHRNDTLSKKYKGISNHVSIVYDIYSKEIRIRTDGGRPVRPLFIVENNELKLRQHHVERLRDSDDEYSWPDLVKDGIIEFLDAAEEETSVIAMFPRQLIHRTSAAGREEYRITSYTHCEINPSAINGICASLIPFADHNQSPRVTYQSNMAKQSIGIYMLNHDYRYDTDSHVLNYPQLPLVTTKAAQFSKYDQYPAGINAIVSIQCYMGYNQEDSIIMNSSAIERGLFRSVNFKTKTDEERVGKGLGDADEMFECPKENEITRKRGVKYENLDEDGFPFVGSIIKDGDTIIGKTQNFSKLIRTQQLLLGRECPEKLDVSEINKVSSASEPGHIDSVVLTENREGYRMVKVRIRTQRVPQMGDKFASRHGQKGVMGIALPEVDLPFTSKGMIPDLIMNPHAIPSRMTIGHLMEMWTAKIGASNGVIMDGTCFTDRPSIEEKERLLEANGFHKHGMEVMYCGQTGRKISSVIYFGPCFYQRLKHMTEDKLHFRARGPKTALCHQPNSGLQREGGLRFGEMERDSAITHGGVQFVRERLFLVSDYYTVPICKKCGQIMIRVLDPRPDQPKGTVFYKCNFCRTNRIGGITVEIPYACKLLFQELACMNIKVIISPEQEESGNKLKNAKKVVPGRKNTLDEILAKQQSPGDWADYSLEII